MKSRHGTRAGRTAVALAITMALGACASAPQKSALLGEARSTYERVQAMPEVTAQAGVELQQAQQALQRAEGAAEQRAKPEVVDHYAYLARQAALLAEQRALRKAADQRVAASESERTKIQLQAREREAARASQLAASAQARAAGAARLAQSATAEAEQLRERQKSMEALQQELAELQAERTERGLVVALGNDVLFDTGRAELKAGATRALDRLAQFMQEHPERSVLIEGFTDSTGGETYNLDLSRRRADAVRTALITRGANADRVSAVGYGEEYAVASNANSGGRQLNRRVEVVISDESGRVAAR